MGPMTTLYLVMLNQKAVSLHFMLCKQVTAIAITEIYEKLPLLIVGRHPTGGTTDGQKPYKTNPVSIPKYTEMQLCMKVLKLL